MSAQPRSQCDGNDLLMLVHGELQRSRAIALRLHAARCPDCRARLRQFENLSASLAGAYRNPTLGVRTFGKITPRRRVWASVALFVAGLVLLGGITASHIAASRAATADAARTAAFSRPMASGPFPGCPFEGRAKFGSAVPRFGYYAVPGSSVSRWPAAKKARS